MRLSPRKIAASTNESSGATPISTAVRAAPARRTAWHERDLREAGHDGADGREDEHVARVDVVGERARDERDERDDDEADDAT